MGAAKFRSRMRDGLVVVLLVLSVSGSVHFVVTNPLGPSRIIYQLEAPIIAWNAHCSENSPSWMQALQQYATRAQGAPASQLAYLDPDGHLHHCETGWKDGPWGDHPLQPETRFRFASVTKPVTAAAVLDLVNRGELSLDDRLVDVIAMEAEPTDPRVGDITVAHLLSHKAGWDREQTQDAMFLRGEKPWCPDQYVRLAETTLQFIPGGRQSYSNLGYCLLGVVIEETTGKSYREHIAEQFHFDRNTLRFVDGPFLSDEVVYDTRHENFYDDTYYKYFDFASISSVAGLSGSASDLARQISGQIRSDGLGIQDGSDDPACDPSEFRSCYGYGLYRYQPAPGNMTVFLHGGKFPGSTSVLMVDEHGGVLVWLGAGSKPGNEEAFYSEIYDSLKRYYSR